MKKRLSVLLTSVFCIVASSFPSFAQDPPMEWGEIPIEDLRMTSFPDDTNAAALVLGDYGETSFNNDVNLNFTRHFRLKIFSPRGYDLATFSFDIREDDNDEILDDLEAVTYALNAEGDIVETELDEDDIHKEELSNGWVRYAFTMPALQPGCVVEVQYEIHSEWLWLIRDWEFQYSVPSRWSEYRMKIPKNISYAAVFQGYRDWTIQEVKDESQFVSGPAESAFGQTLVPCRVSRWVLANAPAVRSEPHMTTRADYINRLDLQLAHFAFPGAPVRHFLSDWPTFTDQMLDDKYFGQRWSADSDVKKKVSEVTAGIVSPVVKARAIYDWVTHNITWTGEYDLTTSKDPGEVLTATTGSSAELSFLLLSMFRTAGLPADPILVSTRSQRKMQDLYPLIEQFNHVVVRVNAGGTLYHVDGVDRSRPFHLIPTSVLNRRGFVVNPKKIEFAVLTGTLGYDTRSVTSIVPNTDGSMIGSTTLTYKEYSAVSARQTLRDAEKSPKTLVTTSLSANEREITVDSCVAMNVDSLHLPVIVNGTFSAEAFASQAGELMYVNPHVTFPVSNLFTLEKRDFPVDFGAPRLNEVEVRVTIPEGYAVKELPKNRSISGSRGAFEFSRSVIATAQEIVVKYSSSVKQSEIPPQDYGSLREAYALSAQTCGEMIVLEKKP